MPQSWQQWLDSKNFHVGTYDSTTNRTTLLCKTCENIIEFTGELTQAKFIAGHGDADPKAKEEWKKLNDNVNKKYERHKKDCAPEPPLSPCKFKLSESIDNWTHESIEEYLIKHKPGETLPELFSVDKILKIEFGNPKPMCIFRHPTSYQLSDPIPINAQLLSSFAPYKDIFHARQLELEEKEREENIEQEAYEFVHRILDRAIYTVEKETEHTREAPQKKIKRVGFDTHNIERDALFVYNLLLTEFKNHPGEPLIITPETMATFLDATFYGKPRVEKTLWRWNEQAFGYGGVNAWLLYKPHALKGWLLLCQHEGGSIRLVVDASYSETIKTDTYGFTKRPLPLQFKSSGNEGVVCAVLCNGESDPTKVYDRSLVLPLTILGGQAKDHIQKSEIRISNKSSVKRQVGHASF